MQTQWTHDRQLPAGYEPPLGLRGLPRDLDGLDSLVDQMCKRLVSAGPGGLGTGRLVDELGLQSARALRLLVAYARIAHRIGQVFGVPGEGGYYWAPAAPDAARRMIHYHRRMGRCYMAIAATMKNQGVARETVQMVLDFMRAEPAGQDDRHDELAALVASEGAGLADVVNGLLSAMRETEQGRAALATIGRQHADMLVPRRAYDQAMQALDAARDALVNAGSTDDRQPVDSRSPAATA